MEKQVFNNKNIFIENCNGIGDLIMLTPVLRGLKEKYPSACITILTKKKNIPVIEKLDYIDKICFYENGKLFGGWPVIKALHKADAVCYYTHQPQLQWITRLLGAELSAGRIKKKYRRFKLFSVRLEDDADNYEYKTDYFRRYIEQALGVKLPVEYTCDVSLPDAATGQRSRNILREAGVPEAGGYIVLAPFGNTAAGIPLELLKEIVLYINNKYRMPCVVINDKEDSGIRSLQAELKKKNAALYDLCGKTSLPELLAIIREAALLIATDSGPMHAACAMGVRTIALFSTDFHEKWGPKHNCRVISLDIPCRPCNKETIAICEHKKCMRGITMDRLIPVIDSYGGLGREVSPREARHSRKL